MNTISAVTSAVCRDIKAMKLLVFLRKKKSCALTDTDVYIQLLWVPEAAETRKRNCEIEINPCQIGKTSAKHLHSMNTN